jgi:hypothetical protein
MKKACVVFLRLISNTLLVVGLIVGMAPTQVKPFNPKLLLAGLAVALISGLLAFLIRYYADKISSPTKPEEYIDVELTSTNTRSEEARKTPACNRSEINQTIGLLNKNQKLVILAGLLIIVGMIIFSPWENDACWIHGYHKIAGIDVPSGFYHTIFNPPQNDRIVTQILVVRCAVVFLLTAGITVIIGGNLNRK